jgi:hypothetical protein
MLWLVDQLLVIYLKILSPFSTFFKPFDSLELLALFLLDQLISSGVYQNSFGCFWLSEPIVRGDDLFDGTLWIVLEFVLPIIQRFGVCIAIFGYNSQCLFIEYLLLVLVKLHKLMKIKNRLQHGSGLDLALSRLFDAFHDLLSLIVVQNLVKTQERNIVELLCNGAINFSNSAANIENRVGTLL